MGTRYGFRCESCGYQAEVSGGRDAGMATLTATVACEDCRRLYDVPTSEHPLDRNRENEIPIQCPVSPAHRVRLWQHPSACPKCGSTMKRGREVMVWD
jgi:Zn finger protein HypA/HybF involved in hydrogenase expression